MKLSYIYTFFILGITGLVVMGSSGGRAAAADEGNTGAPGDAGATCITCHGNSAAIQTEIFIDLIDAVTGIPADVNYIPNRNYALTIRHEVSAGAPAAYGFQLLCLNAEEGVNGPEASMYGIIAGGGSDNVQFAQAASTGRFYAEHNGPSDSPEFNFAWTGPEEGSGPVTFYVCGNAVNLNGETSGDNADCHRLSLTEATSSTNDQAGLTKFLISPNPTVGNFSLLLQGDEYQEGMLRIHDMSGRLVFQQELKITSGESTNNIAFDAPSKGLYLVQVSTPKGMRTEKLMVQ